MTYSEIQTTEVYKSDTNHCTVVASSVAFGLDYQWTHEFYKSNGRRNGHGVSGKKTRDMIYKIAELKNYRVETMNYAELSKISKGKRLTVNNFTNYLPSGHYILSILGHVVGVRDGKVMDWTKGRRHWIRKVYKLTSNVKHLTFFDKFVKEL